MQDIVTTPIIVNTNPRIKERLQSINRFFSNDLAQKFIHDEGDAPLNAYLKNLLKIDLSFQISNPTE